MTGPDARQERVMRALTLTERLAAAMVTRPADFKMAVDVGSVLVDVQFTAHNSDVRTLVGTDGAHLAQIAWLLRRMLAGTDMQADIGPIVSVGEASAERLPPSRTDGPGPDGRLRELLLELARACYPGLRVALKVRSGANKTHLVVVFDREPEHKRDFAKAVGLLFLPVGRVIGHRLVVDARVVQPADLVACG